MNVCTPRRWSSAPSWARRSSRRRRRSRLLVPTPAGVMLAWLAAGVLTLLGALVCAELASAFPRTGGVYVFLRELYGPALGFLWGWAMFWSMHTGIAAAIATVFARYAGTFLALGDTSTRIVNAVAAIKRLSAVNYIGTRLDPACRRLSRPSRSARWCS
ncbi:MAG: amino acid permease [Vicinamibacterales bacterium]